TGAHGRWRAAARILADPQRVVIRAAAVRVPLLLARGGELWRGTVTRARARRRVPRTQTAGGSAGLLRPTLRGPPAAAISRRRPESCRRAGRAAPGSVASAA